jgi:hypothetical protein
MIESIDPIKQYLPTTGWLADYVKFTDGMEACTRFNFFSACCVLGAAINNKAWIQRGDATLLPKLFPNVWVILLAPPGRGHKTSTINMACNCLTEARDDVRILADKLTPELLVKSLAAPSGKEIIRIGPRDAVGLIKAPELSVFFGKQNYNVGLVSLITDLYDYREKWSAGTIARGIEFLRNVCISVIGGSTPQWLQNMLPQDAFTGGFMSRYVIVEMPPNYFKKVAEPETPDDITWVDLVQQLKEISMIEGELNWGVDGRKLWVEIYEQSLPTGEAQVDAYREREAEQILKIAMLITISNLRMEVTGDDLTCARILIRELQKETNPRIERLTTSPGMQTVQEIEDLLKLHGDMDDISLLRMLYKTLTHGEKQFWDALNLSVRIGKIKPFKVSKEGEVVKFKYTLRGE